MRDTNFRSGAAWPYVVDGARRPIGTTGPILVNSARSVRDLVVDDIREGRLRRLLTRYQGPSLEAYAVHAGGRNAAPKVQRCVDHLRQSFGAG